MNYILDAHCNAILDEYKSNLPQFIESEQEIVKSLKHSLSQAGILVAAVESRVKTQGSLAGKLELKGHKYSSLADLTDILGVRIITFFIDDIDKVASAVERLFTVDWENTVDKRKIHDIDSFGYVSLHYICSVPNFPYRFEIQIRTLLMHAWANMDHESGYKAGVEIPVRYSRSMSRLAGMLELVDEEFSKIRVEINDYRRRVQALVKSGNLDEAPLDGDTMRSYLEISPFDQLNRRIAAMNQAEIQETSLMPFLAVFKELGFKTVGDIARLIKNYSEGAYQIACFQLGLTELDIISSSLGPQNLCVAFILKNGGGKTGLKKMFDLLNGESDSNEAMAQFIMEQSINLPFMNNI